jgi:hypothetical protein
MAMTINLRTTSILHGHTFKGMLCAHRRKVVPGGTFFWLQLTFRSRGAPESEVNNAVE